MAYITDIKQAVYLIKTATDPLNDHKQVLNFQVTRNTIPLAEAWIDENGLSAEKYVIREETIYTIE